MRGIKKKTWIVLSTVAPWLALPSTEAAANERLMKQQKDPATWVMQGKNYAGTRYSALDKIHRGNVERLEPAWQFSTGVLRGHEGGPLVVDGMLYVHTPFPNKLYAIDLDKPGEIAWMFDPEPASDAQAVACCDVVNRGPAYADGKLFLTTLDAHIVAIDAKTGEEIWRRKDGDYEAAETITMSPLVVDDLVFVGNSGGEYGVRGHLTAYQIDDGARAWRAFSTGSDEDVLIDPSETLSMGSPIGEKDLGLKSWPGDEWKRGGGTVWGWLTYDPDLDLIYYGTGNPGTWNANQRPGDNKWSMSIFARDPDTGQAAWVYQKTPHDEWDYDGVNENILADIEVDGELRKALINFDRNGFAYTIDRETGVPLVAEKFEPTTNWAERIDLKTGRPVRVEQYSPDTRGVGVNTTGICPAAVGAKDQQPAAYSPRTDLFYVPTNHLCMDYQPLEISYVEGQPYVGAIVQMYAAEEKGGKLGRFIAWDASEGEAAWTIPERFAVWSGALATAGDVVFYGTMDGYAKAVDAKTGEILWEHLLPSGIVGTFATFEHGGRQFVAVLSGIGGWAALGLTAGLDDPTAGLGVVGAFSELSRYTNMGGTMTVFALPESEGESVAAR